MMGWDRSHLKASVHFTDLLATLGDLLSTFDGLLSTFRIYLPLP